MVETAPKQDVIRFFVGIVKLDGMDEPVVAYTAAPSDLNYINPGYAKNPCGKVIVGGRTPGLGEAGMVYSKFDKNAMLADAGCSMLREILTPADDHRQKMQYLRGEDAKMTYIAS